MATDWTKFRNQVIGDCKKNRATSKPAARYVQPTFGPLGYKGHWVLIPSTVDGFNETVQVLNVAEFDECGQPKTYRVFGTFSDSPEFVAAADIIGIA